MSKFIRRLSLVTVLLMAICPFFVNANAIDGEIINPSADEAISMVLQGMSQEAGVYGLGNVDFSDLSLGGQIPAYEVKTNGLNNLSDLEYYPVYENNNVVATAVVAYNEDGLPIATVSQNLADVFSEYYGEDIALVFDRSNMYVWDGLTYDCVRQSTRVNEGRSSLGGASTYTFGLNISRGVVEPHTPLYMEHTPMATSTQAYLNVPKVQQPTNISCWAACIKSIGGYYGINRSINQICTLAGLTTSDGANIYQVGDTLEGSPFNFTVTYEMAGGNSCMSFSTLKYYIDSGIPLYGAVDYTARSQATGHALVIRGYYTYTNSSSYAGSISYMDPDSASYAASNVAKSGSRPYVYTYAETGAEVAKITNFLAISE